MGASAISALLDVTLSNSQLPTPNSQLDPNHEGHEANVFFVTLVHFVVEIVLGVGNWELGVGRWALALGVTSADLPGRAWDPSLMRLEAS